MLLLTISACECQYTLGCVSLCAVMYMCIQFFYSLLSCVFMKCPMLNVEKENIKDDISKLNENILSL